MGRIVRGRYSSQQRVGFKYLALAGEVENLWAGTYRDLAFKTIGVSNLLYERACINQTSESIEVIEKGARIIHDEMDLGNRLVVWGNLAIAMKYVVGKDACKVIPLLSPGGSRTRPRCGDALEQRYLRQIVQRTLQALAGYGLRVEILVVSEVKGSVRSRKRKFPIDFFAG